MKAGDIILVRDRHEDTIGQLIMAGERGRYPKDADAAAWTHSALIVSDTGDLVEANQPGIQAGNVSKYKDHITLILSPEVGDEYRAYACRFAVAQIGTKYDVLDFVGLAVQCLFGWQISLHSDKRFICSGLVSRATECYTTSGYPLPSEAMMPADLAVYFGGTSGQALPSRTAFGRFLDVVRGIFNR